MKKAVIQTGGKQYLVSEGEVLEVELLKSNNIAFEPLLVINDEDINIGQPLLEGSKVKAELLGETKADKVTAIRYKAKKRVKKLRGHRQRHTRIKIVSIE